MNKLIPFLVILVSIPLALFSLDVRVGPLEVRTTDRRAPVEVVAYDPGHPICFAIANRMPLEIVTRDVQDNKVTVTTQLFEPILLGKNDEEKAVLVGKNSKDNQLMLLPLKEIEDFRVMERMQFDVDDEMREEAEGMVEEVICN